MLYQSTSTIIEWIIPARGRMPQFMRAEVPGSTPNKVGIRLRLTCEALGLTNQEFGRRAGISKSAISNILNGRNYPTIPNLVALCEAHELTLDWICAGHFKGMPYELVEKIKVELAREVVATPRRISTRA